MKITLNIGLQQSTRFEDPKPLSLPDMEKKLTRLFGGSGRVEQSATEQTLVWTGTAKGKISQIDNLDHEIFVMATNWAQDCISYQVEQSTCRLSCLTGLYAYKWGHFDPKQFIT